MVKDLELELHVEPREGTGSKAVGRLRGGGVLPAVVYGEGKPASVIQVKEHEVDSILRHHASGNVLLDLVFEGGTRQRALLKDIQYHPISGRVVHADFHTVSMTDKLTISVPLVLVGEPEGVTQQGGTLEPLVRDIEVACLPTDIPEKIEVDVSLLKIGDMVTAAELVVDTARHTILTAPGVGLVTVAAPRVEEEEAEEEGEEAAEAASGEPEVIGAKKDDEEESKE